MRVDPANDDRDLESITRYRDLAGTQPVGSIDFTFGATGRLTNLEHKNAAATIFADYV